jgi:RNA polymerase sigma-70 factor, ECF subfamily
VLAATVRFTRDLDLAEDCVQDAFTRALTSWARHGVPERPGAWLTTVARNRARDLLGRDGRFRRMWPQLVVEETSVSQDPADQVAVGLDDDRLRLIFICCHPALTSSSQVALTLRLVGGLSTADVARAFLVREPTMAARITRAKKKIAAAHIPFRVPSDDELPYRIDAVLEVVHLIFTTGHTAPSGGSLLREDLVANSIRLARLLHELLPTDPQVSGLLALLLLTDARRRTRVAPTGRLILLADQDRSQWDRAMIAEGARLVEDSLTRRPSRYGLQAAIAAVHAEAPTWEATDWPQIVALYDVLAEAWPSPVVDLNRAVAIGFRDGPDAGLRALDPLLSDPSLATYPYLSAARADLLRRLGRSGEAALAYQDAVVVTDNEVERAYLQQRLDESI